MKIQQFIEGFFQTPAYPDSAYTSRDNPTQYSELPDYSKLDLELPIFGNRPKQTTPWLRERRKTWATILAAFALGASWLAIAGLGEYLAWIAGLVTLIYLRTIMLSRCSHWRVTSAMLPALVGLAICYSASLLSPSFVTLFVAMVISVHAADRLATQTMELQTIPPTLLSECKMFRESWKKRFARQFSSQYIEWYPLVLFTPAILYIVSFSIFLRGSDSPLSIATTLLFVVTAWLIMSVSLLLATEFVLGKIRLRPYLTPRRMYYGMKRAVRRFCVYNWRNQPGVGNYHASTGNCQQRWTQVITVASLGILAAAAQISVPQDYQVPAKAIQASSSSQTTVLQPYQKAFLDRLTEDERNRWEVEIAGPRSFQKNTNTSTFDAETVRYLTWIVSPIVCFFAGLALTLTTPMIVVSRLGARFPKGVRAGHFLTPEIWQDITKRVANCDDRRTNESIFMGVNSKDNTPVLIPRAAFKEHVHILGKSGSHKTSCGLIPLIIQLMEHGDASVVVMDLKGGDTALFETLRIESEKRAMRFRWHTLQRGESTYVFNPVDQQYLKGRSPQTKADFLTQALGLQYGVSYGPSFFSDANSDHLAEVITYAERKDEVRSFRELCKASEEVSLHKPKRGKDDSSHVKMVLRRMAELESVNAISGMGHSNEALENAIDCTQFFRSPQVCHFDLGSGDGSITSANLAQLALHSIFKSALHLRKQSRVQTYVVIDEFQRILSPSLKEIFQQARSLNISLIVAHQSLEDLKQSGLDLTTTVEANVQVQQYFSVTTKSEIQDLSITSGNSVVLSRSTSQQPGEQPTVSFAEVEHPRLTAVDCNNISAKRKRSIIRLKADRDYAQYGGLTMPIDSEFAMSFAEHERRSKQPWPALTEETVICEDEWTRQRRLEDEIAGADDDEPDADTGDADDPPAGEKPDPDPGSILEKF